ncbi:MAG: mechanosensitive ion channel family protein, partial [Bacteroidetes bacterium]
MNNETISFYFNWLNENFVAKGMNETLALGLSTLINCLFVVILVALFDVIARKVIVKAFRIFSNRTKTNFDNFLVESNFPKYIAHILPLGLVWYFEPFLFDGYPFISKVLKILIDIYFVLLSVWIIRSVLRSTMNYLNTKEKYGDKPLKSYVQILMIFAWGIGVFFIINIITGFSLASLTTLGAASAALLLIFRDTILGFVASIQVSVND